MSTNSEQMNGIYLTPEGKAELEAKIAELEEHLLIKQKEFTSHMHLCGFLEGQTHLLKEILSSATVLPVEESWERLEENLLEGLHEHTNNKKFELLIDEAYLTYREEALSVKEAYESGDLLGSQPHIALFKDPEELILLDRESFFQKCKAESDFAKRWNLEIQEER